jgi:hypothetical protein
MRIRYIFRGSFQKNEVTLFHEAMTEAGELTLGHDDCILLVSQSEKLLKFVWRQITTSRKNVDGTNGKLSTVVSSQLYRIVDGGTWNPLMLANYAEQVGIQLEGLKKFEQYYRALRADTAEA